MRNKWKTKLAKMWCEFYWGRSSGVMWMMCWIFWALLAHKKTIDFVNFFQKFHTITSYERFFNFKVEKNANFCFLVSLKKSKKICLFSLRVFDFWRIAWKQGDLIVHVHARHFIFPILGCNLTIQMVNFQLDEWSIYQFEIWRCLWVNWFKYLKL